MRQWTTLKKLIWLRKLTAAPSGNNLFIPKDSTGLLTADGKTFRVKGE